MLVGFTLDFRNPSNRSWRELWEDNLWLMCQAEAMGFDYLLVQEHFFQADGYGPSVPVFLTLLAERTKKVRLAPYIYILPLHNPAQLAQETAVLDQISEGRLDVMVGGGHSVAEYGAFGLSPKTRPSRMEEGLTILKKAWTERPFSFLGRHYDLRDVTVIPPLQDPHPPLWVGATSIPAARRAARHGAHLASASADPVMFDAYFAELEASGMDRHKMQISKSWAFTTTYEDPERVWNRNRALYQERWSFYSRIREAMGDAALRHSSEPDRQDYRNAAVIGDPQYILETIRKFCEKVPVTMAIHSCTAGIPVRTELFQNLKLFAEKVLPEIKGW